jgi:hypothetical protein
MPKVKQEPQMPVSSIVELARSIDPTICLTEIRPGVTRKVHEWSVEQWCRICIGARASGIAPIKFIRIVMQDYLDKHTVMPEFLPPAKMGVSKRAFEIGSNPQRGSEVLSADPFAGLNPPALEELRP